MRRIASIVLAAALAPAAVSAQGPYTAALKDYRHALVELESHGHGASVENVFEWGLRVRQTLLLPDPSGVTVIEALSTSEYESIKRDFTGFLIGRDEFVFATADPAFFVDLAARFGDAVDRTFFEAYQQTYPKGAWPVWIEQQADANTCTKFDDEVIARYRTWIAFREANGHRYRETVERVLTGIEDALSGSTCACGDSASVLKVLEEFARAFPETRAGGAVRRRIEEVRANQSSIRFHCVATPASRIAR